MAVEFTPAARRDLDNIWDYTVETWGMDQAKVYVGEIGAVSEALAAGQINARPADFIREGYLKHPVGRHMIYFKWLNKGRIAVIRILHQRQDVDNQF